MNLLLVLGMTLTGSVAALFLKKASGAGGLLSMFRTGALYLGAALYLLSSVVNIVLLRRLDYSVVLPLTSLTYIWTMFLSARLLGEKLTRRKLAGVGAILAGAVMIAM
jgi:drug/metabolite transporter (DMT)-like permease